MGNREWQDKTSQEEMMTLEEILKRKVIYPELQDIKFSDPEKYREITKKNNIRESFRDITTLQ